MKLATLNDSGRDGTLVVLSKDTSRYLRAVEIPTLQAAIEKWDSACVYLGDLQKRVESNEGESTDSIRFAAPLPRAWQWLDGSAFDAHGVLMRKAFKLKSEEHEKPLMYQGMSHCFLGPYDDVELPREEDGIDFEGEFGVIVDEVPMGVSPEGALDHIKLIVQINDWSLRAIAPAEMKTGFGWVQAKPACSVAPFAITPDELEKNWKNGRVHLRLDVRWNGESFGHAHGGEMGVGFHDLVAHAASTRVLCAGTVIGSGTVANTNFREVGSSCINERRGIEIIDSGIATTPFMSFGDTVFMEARAEDGSVLFGHIEQKVCRHK